MAMENEINLGRVFLIGAAKCGTTTLDAMLRIHPEVYMSPIKEPNYFSTDIDPRNFSKAYRARSMVNLNSYFSQSPLPERHLDFVRDPNQYRMLFEGGAKCKWLGESSTSYLYSKEAPQQVFNQYPEASIIVCLRDPVDRLKSHLKMALQEGYIAEAGDEAIESDMDRTTKGWGISELFLELGRFGEQLERWLAVWPKERIHFVFFEELKTDQEKVWRELCSFLNVTIFALDTEVHSNAGSVPKYPKLNSILKGSQGLRAIKDSLPESLKNRFKKHWQDSTTEINIDERRWREYYKPDIQKLEQLLDRSFNHWK